MPPNPIGSGPASEVRAAGATSPVAGGPGPMAAVRAMAPRPEWPGASPCDQPGREVRVDRGHRPRRFVQVRYALAIKKKK